MKKSKESFNEIVDYLALPYSIVIRPADDAVYEARVQELPGCIADGDTAIEAIQNLREVQELWIEECLAAGMRVPMPEDNHELPSGKWVQRVPRKLHARLTEAAKKEGVSLNQLVTSMLSEAIAGKTIAEILTSVLANRPSLNREKSAYHGEGEIAALWKAEKEMWSGEGKDGPSVVTEITSHRKKQKRITYAQSNHKETTWHTALDADANAENIAV